MLNTTLCYVTRGNEVLMLHRVKKKNDINKDKWIGIGGKFEENESPDECLLREAREETGLKLTSWQCRGIVTFLNDCCEGEYMYLFTADGFEGDLKECDEGDLQWISREFLNDLPKWEGDKLVRGTVVRHLILPGQVENSLRVLDWLGAHFKPGEILVSLMRQYTPMEATKKMPPFDRKITDEEYDAVLSWMYLNDLEGFIQEDEAADKAFIPDF